MQKHLAHVNSRMNYQCLYLGAISINPRAGGSPSESESVSSQFPHEQCYIRVNSLTNDAIQYGTHGTHSASQFHEQYDAVRMIRAWQDPHER